jgi:type VI secretion system protein ImpH
VKIPLLSEPFRFRFFQAVRLLERMQAGRHPVGRWGHPAREAVRFRSHASLAFPPSDIVSIEPGEQGRPPVMTVAFAGLTGPSGILPHPYTELLMERRRGRDHALGEFLDIFLHRLLSFFYRAWEKYRFMFGFERDQHDPFTRGLQALVGLGTPGLGRRMAVPDQVLLFHGGLAAQRPVSAWALQAILTDYFRAPVAAAQFQRQWFSLEPGGLSRLGAANCGLGRDARLGERVLVAQSKLRLRVGPLDLGRFLGFLPTGAALRELAELATFLAGPELDLEAQLLLAAGEVPPCHLADEPAVPPLLGWTTWLKTRPFTTVAADTVLPLDPFGLAAEEERAA